MESMNPLPCHVGEGAGGACASSSAGEGNSACACCKAEAGVRESCARRIGKVDQASEPARAAVCENDGVDIVLSKLKDRVCKGDRLESREQAVLVRAS